VSNRRGRLVPCPAHPRRKRVIQCFARLSRAALCFELRCACHGAVRGIGTGRFMPLASCVGGPCPSCRLFRLSSSAFRARDYACKAARVKEARSAAHGAATKKCSRRVCPPRSGEQKEGYELR